MTVRPLDGAMSHKSRKHALKLGRSIGDRILVGCLALPISLISGLGLWMVATRSRGSSGVVATLWKLVIDEALIAIFVLSALSVLWAVAAPRWMERLLQRSAVKAAFATLVLTGILWWMYGLAQNR